VIRWTEAIAPYQYGGAPAGALDTATLANGAHTLATKAYTANGKSATAKVSVTVSNSAPPTVDPPPTPFSVSSSITSGTTLGGVVIWTATASRSVAKIEFKIDGVLRWTESL